MSAKMSAKLLGAAILAAAATTTAAPAAADQATASAPCFSVNQWRGWSAPSEDVLLLRVRSNEVYRVELLPGSHVRRSSGDFLVNEVRGSSRICSPVDLDLKVSDGHGFTTPLFVRSIARLTPQEVAALPRADRP